MVQIIQSFLLENLGGLTIADSSKILVTGATGNTGALLVPMLRKADLDVRVFMRDESKEKPFREMGAEVILGDLDQPEMIEPAVDGVGKIYLLTWNGPTQAQQAENVIKSAKKNGNPYIIRHAMWEPENSRIIKQGDQILWPSLDDAEAYILHAKYDDGGTEHCLRWRDLLGYEGWKARNDRRQRYCRYCGISAYGKRS